MMRKAVLLSSLFLLTGAVALAAPSEDQPIARLSYIEGHVSFQHPGEVDWSAASVNMALQVSDRLYTGETGRAEVQFDDGSVLRLAEKTDLEILGMKEDLVQVRILLGLTSLTARGSVPFEIDTPAAAFTTLEKGAYRFDVVENGDSDAIVREGQLSAANEKFSGLIEKGEVLHVTPGEQGTSTLARYDQRDSWDEWTDRRDADMMVYQSRQYLPDYVYAGASDLDRYGYWVDVGTYGPAWVPYAVGPSWSPYWDGRWVYRPFWGWTWVSYEPWGWLPYHYGRWHFAANIGWCWLPGPSFGFHFWSPGLVRFFHGPGWVSWCPLGPGDYYNANRYFYRSGYAYRLTDMRLMQHRGPEDLVNRDAPGALRRMGLNDFVNGGPRGSARLAGSDPDFFRGNSGRQGLVLGALPVQPSTRSFMPDPDRASARPPRESSLPTIVRHEPAAGTTVPGRFIRAGGATAPVRATGNDSVPEANRGAVRPSDQRGRTSPPAAAIKANPVNGRSPVNSVTAPRTQVWNRVTPAPADAKRGLPGERTDRAPAVRQPAPKTPAVGNRNQTARPAVQPRAVEPRPRPDPRPPAEGRMVEPVNPRTNVGTSRTGTPPVYEYRSRVQAPALSGRSYLPATVTGGRESARASAGDRATDSPNSRSYQPSLPGMPSRSASPQVNRAPSFMSRPSGMPSMPSRVASPQIFRSPSMSSGPAGPSRPGRPAPRAGGSGPSRIRR